MYWFVSYFIFENKYCSFFIISKLKIWYKFWFILQYSFNQYNVNLKKIVIIDVN